MLGAERLVYGQLGDTLFTVRLDATLPPPEGRRHRQRSQASPAAPALVRRRDARRASAPEPRPRPRASRMSTLALSPLDRAPRRRQAGAREHAGRISPRRGHGYRAFECDVKLSADGVPFLLHDATLERTTLGHGAAPATALERAVAARRRRLAQPRLRRRADAEPRRDRRASACATAIALEHRDQADARAPSARPAASSRATAAALWAGAGEPPLLSSFQPAALAAARASGAATCRARCCSTRLREGWLDRGAGAGLRRRRHQLHGDGRRRARQHPCAPACAALCYTVNDPAEARRLDASASTASSPTRSIASRLAPTWRTERARLTRPLRPSALRRRCTRA